MSPKQRRRLAFAVALLAAGAGGAVLIVYALQDNVLYFYSPSDVAVKHVEPGVAFRIGGLFREGQGVVAEGVLTTGGTFQATEVLAKHDEKYMPPEVVQALKRAGRWK